ncbi:MAG: mechanosensitive ion channel, partial [Gammaproteobacteria bacterium]|nr:mechanosensitive ion channel [Gammaproteobacteria bacterium]
DGALAQVSAETPRSADAPSIQTPVSRAQLEAKLAELEENTELSSETKQQLSERYRNALANLESMNAFESEAATYLEALDTAPEKAAALRAEAGRLKTAADPPVELPAQVTVAEIEQLLAREQAEAAALEAQLAELDKILSDQSSQPAEVRRRLAEATQELTELEAELNRPQPEGQSDALRQARRWALETRRAALRAEMIMLDQRIVSADARRQLTEARRDQRAAALERLRLRRAYLENEADRLRKIEAERVRAETESAERELAEAAPVVQALAHRNREISETITEVTAALDRIDEQHVAMEEQLQETRLQLKSARERIAAAGLSQAVGQILVDERADLPDPGLLRERADERAEEIAEVTFEQIQLREALRRLDEIDAAAEAVLEDADAPADATLRAQVIAQLERQRDLLERALRVQDSYQRSIGDLDFTADQYADVVTQYRDFLAEHLLWVRSTAPITEQPLAPLKSALWWLIAPQHWGEVLESMARIASSSPLFWLGLLLFAALLATGPRLRRRIRGYSEPMRRISTDRFGYSVSALGLTLLVAAPWPLLSALLGWELSRASAGTPFSLAVGSGLFTIALPFYFLRAFRLLCMPNGLADRHFRWSASTLRTLRRTMQWMAWVLLPLGFVGQTAGHYDDPGFNGTLTRFIVVAIAVGLTVLTALLAHPKRGLFAAALQAQPQGWLNKTRHLWYPTLVAVPIVLAGVSLAGYLYTAGILLRSLLSELWLALALVVAHQMIVRWLIVTRRGLALEAALERRAQREAQREAAEQGAQRLEAPDEPVDLAALDSQTRRLLNSVIVIVAAIGLWMIWSDVLPALNVFDQQTLWSYTTEVEGAKELVPVTLADVGLILIIGAAAVVAVKNLPALLEILLLKNSSITASGRYTLVKLTRYLITAIGALLVFSALGLSWGEVQWLIAALGVGIGFGLQEIVANFISGLIILFERPVRVGDIVTIGDTTGTVSKIEIRATTIRNWDRQELLVPNKEFITGRLLNWTLSDQLNRVVIPVGIEYGSDTRKALALLSEAAAEHPLILDDPEPMITFEGFGDNALNLVLRCYLETLDFRLAAISELHQAIDDKFRAAGIGIAFPQRDIHLRSAEPIEIRMRRTAALPTNSPQSPAAPDQAGANQTS